MGRINTVSVVENDKVITLRDGRTLGFAEYGKPGGRPVFYFMDTLAVGLKPNCLQIMPNR